MMEHRRSANAPEDRSTIEMAPWLAERRIRNVPEDDDDFFLDEFYDDDYEYRRIQARRPDPSERQYFEFWD